MSESLPDLIARLRVDMSDLDGAVGRATRVGSAIGSAVGTLAAGGIERVLSGVGDLASMGFEVAAGNEQARISFTTMLGSATKADAFLKQMQQFAATTPFEFPELQTAASSLISAGINADKVIPIMRSLGDTTAGMGTGAEGVQRATIALQQMNAAGKITGEDLNQLRDAGIPVYDLLAAATGKSKSEVVALAQAGKLGGKELGQLMGALETGKGLERFSGLMDKQSQSITGLVSTFKDNLGQGLATAITPVIPLLKDGLAVGADLAAKGTAGLADGLAWLMNTAKALEPALNGIYRFLVLGDYTGKGGLGQAFGLSEDDAIVGKMFDIRDAVVGMIDQVKAAIGPAVDTVRLFIGTLTGAGADVGDLPWMNDVIDLAGGIASAFSTVLMPAISALIGFWQQMIPPIMSAVQAIGVALIPVIRGLVAFIFGGLVPVLATLVSIFRTSVLPVVLDLWQTILAKVVPVVQQLAQQFVVNVLPALMRFAAQVRVALVQAQPFIALVASIIGWLLKLAVTILVNVVGAFIRFAGPVISALIGSIGRTISIIGSVLGWIGRIAPAIAGAASGFGQFVSSAGSKVGEFFTMIGGIPGRITSAIGDLGGLLYGAGRSILQGLINGIQDKIGELGSVLGGVGSFIQDHKGPPSKDAVMLTRNGQLIMGGLMDGIASQVPALGSLLGSIGAGIGSSLGAPSLAGGASSASLAGGSRGMAPSVRVWIGDRELTDMIRTETDASLGAVAGLIDNGVSL